MNKLINWGRTSPMLGQSFGSRPIYYCSSWRINHEYIYFHPRMSNFFGHLKLIYFNFLEKKFTPISKCDIWMESLWWIESLQNNSIINGYKIMSSWTSFKIPQVWPGKIFREIFMCDTLMWCLWKMKSPQSSFIMKYPAVPEL